jgi:hypothetical protein
MKFEWEIAYIDLNELQLVLRSPKGRCSPMIPFDTAEFHDWQVGDKIAVDHGDISNARQRQKTMGVSLSEDNYLLYNERKGGKAVVRKNDYEVENAFDWLKTLVTDGKVCCNN